ncbi:hypothetical protein BpHYR1_027883 [Brachionus plicatilis]|uniref:Uncharacterized protein n=1 Tax=Brachionus plicatilis TaxID=10195 RepID=A0A3M7RE26_BRAPC|nr:hypothetical protein BpHYR1_027883 [Brachionus plicatilis]
MNLLMAENSSLRIKQVYPNILSLIFINIDNLTKIITRKNLITTLIYQKKTMALLDFLSLSFEFCLEFDKNDDQNIFIINFTQFFSLKENYEILKRKLFKHILQKKEHIPCFTCYMMYSIS